MMAAIGKSDVQLLSGQESHWSLVAPKLSHRVPITRAYESYC